MTKETILIVDDTPANLAILFEYLNEVGFKVLVDTNGISALENIKQAHPDIILLDVMMPGLDGFATCHRLKRMPQVQHIPVIFMTALTDVVDKVRGFEVGGADYITKPIQPPEVLARVEAHLTIKRLQTALQQQNERLEMRVHKRTASLQAEIARREEYQQEKEKMFDIIQQQNNHLQTLSKSLLESQQNQQKTLAQSLHQQVTLNLQILSTKAKTINKILSDDNDPKCIKEEIKPHLTMCQQILDQTQTYLQDLTFDLEHSPAEENPLRSLSIREQEVLQLIIKGYANPQIAQTLSLSPNTIRTYRSRIMNKLDVSNVSALIKLALKYNLMSV